MPKNTDGTFTLCKHCLLQVVREQCAGRGVCALERERAMNRSRVAHGPLMERRYTKVDDAR